MKRIDSVEAAIYNNNNDIQQQDKTTTYKNDIQQHRKTFNNNYNNKSLERIEQEILRENLTVKGHFENVKIISERDYKNISGSE